KEGRKLEQTARLIQKTAEAKNMPATKRAALNMQKLGRRMAQGRMDKKQAMVRMAQLTKQMQAQQRQLAQQAGQAALGGGKSLSQAGQQLAAALQSQAAGGQNAQGASKMQGAHSAGSKSTGEKSGANGGNKPAGQNAGHGFNVPGRNKPGDKPPQNALHGAAQPTPEMKQIAQALQQNNAQTLSEQLRQLARKAETGQMTPQQQQQAAQDLQKLADALQGTGMPETQQHAQAAAQAMAHGDKQTAAAEMRKAADAAEREAQQQQDAQGMQDAQNSLQDSQGEMAGAQDPGDIPDGPSGQGQGQKPGGKGQGQTGPPEYGGEGNGGRGGGRGKPNTTYHKGQKPSHKIRQKPGYGADAPHWLDPHFDPAKNPRYAKLYFGKPRTAGPSQAGPTRKTRPGEDTGPVRSTVPYYNSVVSARKTAENAMDREDIPPAYKKNVADYFNSLQPQSPPPPASSGAGGTKP
ncbi:MAG: hypothetical protein JO250_00190, partial [Armatimonadetes bacterium]|nr:hypothetical protein [Armatimonadota bacterium]